MVTWPQKLRTVMPSQGQHGRGRCQNQAASSVGNDTNPRLAYTQNGTHLVHIQPQRKWLQDSSNTPAVADPDSPYQGWLRSPAP